MASTQFIDEKNLGNAPGVRYDGFVQGRILIAKSEGAGRVAGHYNEMNNSITEFLQGYNDNTGTYFSDNLYIGDWSPSVSYTDGSIVRVAGTPDTYWWAVNPVVGVSPVAPAWTQLVAPSVYNTRSPLAQSQQIATPTGEVQTSIHQSGVGANRLGENVALQIRTKILPADPDVNRHAVNILADGFIGAGDASLTIEPQSASVSGVDGLGTTSIDLHHKASTAAETGKWTLFSVGSTDGGLTEGHLQLFTYKAGPYQPITELWDIAPLVAGSAVGPVTQTGGTMLANFGTLDPLRCNTFVGTGAAQLINVPSITGTSKVIITPVGFTAADLPIANPQTGLVVVANADAPGRGFTNTFVNGVAYTYLVIG